MEVTIYDDKSFTLVLKTSPASILLKKAAGVEKGAPKGQQKVGSITTAQVRPGGDSGRLWGQSRGDTEQNGGLKRGGRKWAASPSSRRSAPLLLRPRGDTGGRKGA